MLSFPSQTDYLLTQITRTFYDDQAAGTPTQITPKNLRGRIAAVKVFENGQTQGAATFYDYDIHGNVEKLVQSLPELDPKTVEYSYDLLSGNVHRVTYQKGEEDQFMHRYTYDADNRLEAVFTSSDGYIWDEDARYLYYAHGPMARVELGEYKVQGVDYYYTLQGWIKGVNLQGDHDAEATNNVQKYVSKDAFGYALHYYQNDYQSINGNFGWNSTNTSQYKNLYNGNIASMKTTLSSLGELVRDYQYDQLHRIREANSVGNAYKETFTYDANGNIKTNTLHNSEGNQVDNATYHYFAQTNKLHYISDSYGETQEGFDLMNQNVGNFAYDLIGNLVKDKAMEVSSMSWTAYHKREKVVKEDGTTITYRYDAMNNRIYKKVEANGVTETTHYLRDGTGNTLAIYKNGALEELNIYGSSRLGTYNGKTEEGKRTLGNKRYELSNHLGNALVVITDNKIGVDSDADLVADSYIALVVSERDYLAFGAVMAGRSLENEDYTYSFNGKELDKSTGWQDYGFRDYNPVYKRFDMVDPFTQKYPELTPYQFASDSPIKFVDIDGLEAGERAFHASLSLMNQDAAELEDRMKAKHNEQMTKTAQEIEKAVVDHFERTKNKAEAEIRALDILQREQGGASTLDKTKIYIAAFVSFTAEPLKATDLNDAAIVIFGKNIDNTPATTADKVAASAGIFIPIFGGGFVKKTTEEVLGSTTSGPYKMLLDKVTKYDIAFGLNDGFSLRRFADKVDAMDYTQFWSKGFSEIGADTQMKLIQGMKNAIDNGGKVHFDLSKMDNISGSVLGKPRTGSSNLSTTEFELRSIVLNPEFFKNTKFYKDGKLLTPEQVQELGITLQKAE